MPKFTKLDVDEMLGLTPIRQVSDKDVWKYLLTPVVKSLIGPVCKVGRPTLMETERGHFPGDEAANLNRHLLYGGSAGYVRYPYISVCHRTASGALVIKRDSRKLKVTAWLGDVDKGRMELIHLAALKDRRFDGTPAANDSALVSYPYDDPINRPLHPQASSAEISVYSYFPGSFIADIDGDDEYQRFVVNPFSYLHHQPEVFLQHFNRAWRSKRHPGQIAAPLPDVSRLILPGIEKVARKYGYDFIESAASHYHVAMWFRANGFRYSFRQDEETLASFAAGMKRIRDEGTPLTRAQQSWTCVLQSLRPEELIPAHLRLGGLRWPQDNINAENLWLNKPLTDKALLLLPSMLPDKWRQEQAG